MIIYKIHQKYIQGIYPKVYTQKIKYQEKTNEHTKKMNIDFAVIINMLPIDILSNTFEYVDTKTRYNLHFVCTTFYHVITRTVDHNIYFYSLHKSKYSDAFNEHCGIEINGIFRKSFIPNENTKIVKFPLGIVFLDITTVLFKTQIHIPKSVKTLVISPTQLYLISNIHVIQKLVFFDHTNNFGQVLQFPIPELPNVEELIVNTNSDIFSLPINLKKLTFERRITIYCPLPRSIQELILLDGFHGIIRLPKTLKTFQFHTTRFENCNLKKPYLLNSNTINNDIVKFADFV